MGSKIICTMARLDNPAEMSRFLQPIPNGGELASLLLTGASVNTRAFDDDAFTARFVVSDGEVVQCFTVTDITIDQAEMIAIECEGLEVWSNPIFCEAVGRALPTDSDHIPG